MYHFKLCRAILVGFRRQLQSDGKCGAGFVIMLNSCMQNCKVLPVLQIGYGDRIFEVKIDDDTIYRDNLTGRVLDPSLVSVARKKKLDLLEAKGVWVKKGIDEGRTKTGKQIITVSRADVNNGDHFESNARSRLVAREIGQLGEEAIFAPTPPLESPGRSYR